MEFQTKVLNLKRTRVVPSQSQRDVIFIGSKIDGTVNKNNYYIIEHKAVSPKHISIYRRSNRKELLFINHSNKGFYVVNVIDHSVTLIDEVTDSIEVKNGDIIIFNENKNGELSFEETMKQCELALIFLTDYQNDLYMRATCDNISGNFKNLQDIKKYLLEDFDVELDDAVHSYDEHFIRLDNIIKNELNNNSNPSSKASSRASTPPKSMPKVPPKKVETIIIDPTPNTPPSPITNNKNNENCPIIEEQMRQLTVIKNKRKRLFSEVINADNMIIDSKTSDSLIKTLTDEISNKNETIKELEDEIDRRKRSKRPRYAFVAGFFSFIFYAVLSGKK